MRLAEPGSPQGSPHLLATPPGRLFVFAHSGKVSQKAGRLLALASRLNLLISMSFHGAGEEIRTLEPNLGNRFGKPKPLITKEPSRVHTYTEAFTRVHLVSIGFGVSAPYFAGSGMGLRGSWTGILLG
jgi:hypothetical protein